MAKRIIAGILGAVAMFGSLLPFGYAFEFLRDIETTSDSLLMEILTSVLMLLMALTALWIGIRFLQFSIEGRNEENNGWVKPVLLGIGFFFPAWLFSLIPSLILVALIWPTDNRKFTFALEASVVIGVVAAIVCSLLLLRKRRLKQAISAN